MMTLRDMPLARSRPEEVLVLVVLVGVLILGGYLRINMVHDSKIQKDLWADSHMYFTYAYNLRKHGVYSHYNVLESGVFFHSDLRLGSPETAPPPDNFRPPGYPLFLYVFLADLPESIDVQGVKPYLHRIELAQAVLSTVTILISFLLSRYLLGAPLALVPALIVAIAPHLIIANLYVLTETVFCFILTLALLMVVWSHGKSAILNIFVGALVAFGSLIKPAFLYFILPLSLLCAVFARRNARGPLLCSLVLGFAVVYSPWALRNEVTPGIGADQSLIASTLLAGAYPGLIYNDDRRTYPYPFLRDPDYARNSRTTSAALTEIKRRFLERPTAFARWYLVGKPILLWRWDITHGVGGAFVYPVDYNPYQDSAFYESTYALSRWIHRALVLLGLVGAVIAWLPARRSVLSEKATFGFRVISAALIYFSLVYSATFADARYAVPLRPLLAITALLPLLYLHGLARPLSSSRRRT